MKFFINKIALLVIVALIMGISSCKKYLDKQPDQTLFIPKKLSDLQTLLDNYNFMNHNCSVMAELMADDLAVSASDWSVLPVGGDRNIYVWDGTVDYTDTWSFCYKPVFYSNVVLDELTSITSSDQTTYNDIKGQALFFRSFYFWQLAQVYCKPYSVTSVNDPGIALRMTSDANAPTVRSTVKQTYDQIVGDLKLSAALMQLTGPSPMRPDRKAAYGMLARVLLSMREYDEAGKYADSVLQVKNTLLDYNQLNSAATRPIPHLNAEVLFDAAGGVYMTAPPNSKVDPVLYNLYHNDDLRKQLFFTTNADNTHTFRGSYGMLYNFNVFMGLAIDEMYLTRAESYARAGNKDAALADLNTLMQKRWSNAVPYPTITAADAADALNKVLTERRKELLHRALRWSDLRRRNVEGANITLTRVLNSTTYTLPPNDPRWVLLIPYNVINSTGIQQNPR
ncbi:MAG TPA: RagB/SusD family nutrient uptake outer membrane protein [Chitinophagaceae bacterium]|jgi:hypothetical protein|nr:RagB/SusD family nutrient uptake outer membrane protein [Chitinophagaceae bacterium]